MTLLDCKQPWMKFTNQVGQQDSHNYKEGWLLMVITRYAGSTLLGAKHCGLGSRICSLRVVLSYSNMISLCLGLLTGRGEVWLSRRYIKPPASNHTEWSEDLHLLQTWSTQLVAGDKVNVWWDSQWKQVSKKYEIIFYSLFTAQSHC